MFGLKATIAAFPLVAAAVSALPTISKRGFSGTATFYSTGLGSCEWTNKDSDFIVAMNAPQYNKQSQCGKFVDITSDQSGNTQRAQVVDLCPSCSYGSLDMSPALFSALSNGNMDLGVFPISWNWADSSSPSAGQKDSSKPAQDQPKQDQAKQDQPKEFDGSAGIYQTGVGKCTWFSKPSDFVVSLPKSEYDNGSHCGNWIELTNKNTDKTTGAVVVEECEDCEGEDIKLSHDLWAYLNNGHIAQGKFPVSWKFANKFVN